MIVMDKFKRLFFCLYSPPLECSMLQDRIFLRSITSIHCWAQISIILCRMEIPIQSLHCHGHEFLDSANHKMGDG
jgi:hypothetical protein